MGFHQSKHDYSLFTKVVDGHLLVLLVYVDDILLLGASLESIMSTKTALDNNSPSKILVLQNIFWAFSQMAYT